MECINNIDLRSKTAREVYTIGNEEFLAKYDTDDKQIDYYTNLAMKLYDEFQIDGTFTYDGVRKNVAVWFTNKKKQMDLFRKHPYWSEEAKAIVFLQTETRAIDYVQAARELEKLENYVASKYSLSSNQWFHYCLRYALCRVFDDEEAQNGIISESFIRGFKQELSYRTTLPEPIQRMLRCGTKITRFVRKCYEFITLDTGEVVNATTLVDEGEDRRTCKSFDKFYAKFADCLSELTIERITLVSLNFLDFMTMSNGNSWSSCHFINSRGIFHEDAESSYRGLYKGGCVSYALDEPSFILYTLPATYTDTDYYRCQKLTRMCCQYDKGVLITGKCYPNNHDSLITRYRQMMQLIISQVEEVPNLWTYSKKHRKIMAFAETADNALHYPDYTYESQKPTISSCKAISIDLDTQLQIGHESYCLNCGTVVYDHEQLQCNAHRKPRYCEQCGKYLPMSEHFHEISGDYYCDDCVFYCEYHNMYEPLHYKYGTITMADVGEKLVCRYALHEMAQCTDCGTYYSKSLLKDGHCPNCIKMYAKCTFCGEYFKKEELTTHKRRKYCKACIKFADAKIAVIPKATYNVGDYVLMKNDVRECTWGANTLMQAHYSNRVVRITYKNGRTFHVSDLDNHSWSWSKECFVGVVTSCSDEYIGKTLAEIKEMIGE